VDDIQHLLGEQEERGLLNMTARAKPLGFTLIELLVALAVLALLLLLGMPSFTTFVRNSEIRSTAESIVNGLRTASAEAANRNARVAFTLAGGGDPSWAINVVKDPDTKELEQPPIQAYSKSEAGRSTKVTVTPGNRLQVTFTGLGRVQNQGVPNDHLQQIDIGPIVSGEARPLRIVVDDPNPADPAKPRGLRMCDPDPALSALTPPDPRAC
jgi:type IV fimbrial biogenesis protein FimT